MDRENAEAAENKKKQQISQSSTQPDDDAVVRATAKSSHVNNRKIKPLNAAHFLTHFPKHPHCPVCQRCRVQISVVRKIEVDHSGPASEEFGDIITCDWSVLKFETQSRAGRVDQLVILDRATRWLYAYATDTRAHEEIMMAFRQYLGSNLPTPKLVYTDNGPEFIKAFKLLDFSADTSQPHRPTTNGVAERAQRTVKEGTSCLLSQAGLQPDWWVEASRCYCFLHNV